MLDKPSKYNEFLNPADFRQPDDIELRRDPSKDSLQQIDNKLNLNEVKRKLREVFVYYASFGDRLNTENLKSAKFHKMLQDAGIMST